MKLAKKTWKPNFISKEVKKAHVRTLFRAGDPVILFEIESSCGCCNVEEPVRAVFIGADENGEPYFRSGRRVLRGFVSDVVGNFCILESEALRLWMEYYNEETFDLSDYAV